jgi:hypothetical protein
MAQEEIDAALANGWVWANHGINLPITHSYQFPDMSNCYRVTDNKGRVVTYIVYDDPDRMPEFLIPLDTSNWLKHVDYVREKLGNALA